MIKRFVLYLLRMLRGEGVSVEYLRKHGAAVGEDVKLYNFQCSAKDATCLQIGNNVTLSGVHILTHDASLERFTREKATKIGRVVIGNNVFIGIGTIILPNVSVGSNVIVGAGSVVAKNIPDDSVAAGNPARVIESIDAYIGKHLNNMPAENTFVSLNREKMSPEDIKKFNRKIGEGIAYIVEK